jgi:hypothetical protein
LGFTTIDVIQYALGARFAATEPWLNV